MTPQYMSVAAKLATLDDPGLAKYAEVNKEDAILLGLAMAERSRREAVRNAGKASVQAAQGPKVVDTAIANMAMQAGAEQPTAGLSALAAPTRMAYNGGVMRMQSGGENILPRYISSSLTKYDPLAEALRIPGTAPRLVAQEPAYLRKAREEQQKGRKEQGTRMAGSELGFEGAVEGGETPAGFGPKLKALGQKIAAAVPITVQSPEERLQATREAVRSPLAGENREPLAPVSAQGLAAMRAAAEAAEKGQVGGLPAVAAVAPEKAKEAAGLSALPAAATAAVPYKARTREEIGQAVSTAAESEELINRMQGINQAAQQNALAAYDRTKALLGERTEFGTKRMEELTTEMTGLDKEKASNLNMALIQAGFAMMAGDAPTVLQNIGMGALVGTKEYRAGLERIDKKRDKLREAIFEIEKIRRSEKRADEKTLLDANDKLVQAQRDIRKTELDVYGKVLGWSKDERLAAERIYSNEKGTEVTAGLREQEIQARRADTASRERIANMPGATERMYAALANPESPVAKGLANYAKAMGKDKGASMADYAKFAALPSNAALSDADIIKKFLGTYGLISGGLRAPAPVNTPGDGQIRE